MFAEAEWGTVGEWVSGIGSIAAVGTAVAVVAYQVRHSRQESRRQNLANDARSVIAAAAELISVLGSVLQRVRVFRAKYPSVQRRLVMRQTADEMLNGLDGQDEDLARALSAQFRIEALTNDDGVLEATELVMRIMWTIQSLATRPTPPSDAEWDAVTEDGIGQARSKLVDATRHLVASSS